MNYDLEKLHIKLPHLTNDDLAEIRKAMATYALAAVMDSAVRKEAMEICQGNN